MKRSEHFPHISSRRLALWLVPLALLALAGGALAGGQVPFRASVEASTLSADACSDDLQLVCQTVQGSGKATHLGRFRLELRDRVDFAALTFTGKAVWTAASGDALFTEYAGQVTPLSDRQGRVEVTHIVTGGTGRFAGATGRLVGEGLFEFATTRLTVEYGGALSLPGCRQGK